MTITSAKAYYMPENKWHNICHKMYQQYITVSIMLQDTPARRHHPVLEND